MATWVATCRWEVQARDLARNSRAKRQGDG